MRQHYSNAFDRREILLKVKDYVVTQRMYRRLDLTTEMVAEAVGISRAMLIKVMREEKDMSFMEYLTEVRLRQGRHLVMSNRQRFPMEHVALVAGFGSLRTFNAKYKKVYGELPSVTDANNTQKNK